jgi:hypothetical protein
MPNFFDKYLTKGTGLATETAGAYVVFSWL